MPTEKIQFTKIVATPTDDSWSQVYSAGNLYSVIALSKKASEEDATLNVIGKGIINNLEAEFFGLESKNLNSIQSAIQKAIESTPEKVHLNLSLIFIKDGIAYIYIIGEGEIIIQRGKNKGAILTHKKNKQSDEREVVSASGALLNNDLLLIKAPEFDEIVSNDSLTEALSTSTAEEAAEILSPTVHGKEKGGASAAFITYFTDKKALSVHHISDSNNKTDEDAQEINPIIEEPESEDQDLPHLTPSNEPIHFNEQETGIEHNQPITQSDPEINDYFAKNEPSTINASTSKGFRLKTSLSALPKVKKTYLAISAIILILLIGSIVFTNYQKENAELKKSFDTIYSNAQKEIDEGESLEELNADIAQDNFEKAQKILNDNKNKFKPGSLERTKIDELLASLDDKVNSDQTPTQLQTKSIEITKSTILSLIAEKKATLATKNDEGEIFTLTSKEISKISSSKDSESLYKNDNDWKNPVGLGAFGSNAYVLDPENGLLKFVAGSGGYGVSNYFKKDAPDLTKATGMALDASIFILYTDGKIEKYTRGEKDSFTISGLKKPLKSPSQILTSEAMDNIYIFDKGNSRIVKIDKSGTFKAEFTSSILKSASYIDVLESDNLAHILVKDKLYELSLK